jgi:hypothetical protein
MRVVLPAIAGLVLGAGSAGAQAVPTPAPPPASGDSLAYTPRAELPGGRQVVVVYVGMTGCGASRDPELGDAVRRMKPALARQAAAILKGRARRAAAEGTPDCLTMGCSRQGPHTAPRRERAPAGRLCSCTWAFRGGVTARPHPG